MHISFTEPAQRIVREQIGDRGGQLKLVYDAEGCGCALDGIAQLWIVDGRGKDDKPADASAFPVWYEPRHEIFFEDRLRIDYDMAKKSLVLKSDNQIYNARMSLVDKRE